MNHFEKFQEALEIEQKSENTFTLIPNTNYFVGTSGASTSVRDTEKVRFYKVTIYGVRNYAGGNDVRIMRAGVHTDNGIHGMWVGSMDVQIKFRPSNCGNGANYSRIVHNYHANTSSVTQGQGGGNIAKIRDYLSCSESGALYVWLRGQLSYQITVNGRPATVASIDMNDYVTSMDSSVMPAGYDAESRDALSIYWGYQGQTGAGRKLYGKPGGIEAQGNVSATGSKPFKYLIHLLDYQLQKILYMLQLKVHNVITSIEVKQHLLLVYLQLILIPMQV